MAVNDHGLEAIRKSAEEVIPGSKADYVLKTIDGGSFFRIPKEAIAFTVELANGGLDVVYKFRSVGIAGPVLTTVTLTYNSVQTLGIVSGVIS